MSSILAAWVERIELEYSARLSVSLCRMVRTQPRLCHKVVPVDKISAWELLHEAAGDQLRIRLAIPRKSNEALSGYREAIIMAIH